MKQGRPTKYSEEIGLKICNLIAKSNRGLRSICKEVGIDPSTVYYWIDHIENFSKQYARAKEDQADYLVDEMLEIADDTSNDTIIKTGKDGEQYLAQNSEWINRSRLRVDTRKWIASKLKAKKYGERLQHANDPDNPMPQMVLYCPKEEKTDE